MFALRLASSIRACACFIVALIATSGAFAQGHGGTLPEPITLARLGAWIQTRCAPPLCPALAQDDLRAVVAAHDDYRIEYLAMRGDLDAVVDAAADEGDAGATRRRRATAVQRIAALDERLFAAIAEALDGDQRPAFETVRVARSIERSLARQPARDASIVETVRNLRMLTAEERSAIEMRLRDAESRCDALLRQQVENNERFEEQRERRFREHLAAGALAREAGAAAYRETRAAMADWQAPAERLADASLALRNDLAAHISFDAQRELTFRVLSGLGHPFRHTETTFERSVRGFLRTGKNEAMRLAVRDIYQRWAKADDELIASALEISRDPATAEQFRREFSSYRDRRNALASSASRQVAAVLDEESKPIFAATHLHADMFDPSNQHEGDVPTDLPLARLVASDGFSINEAASGEPDRMDWRPRPIESSMVLAWFTTLTPDTRLTVETVLEDARDRWAAEIAPLIKGATKQHRAVSSRMNDVDRELAGEPPPAMAEYSTAAEDLVACRERVALFDAAVFENLAAILGPTEASAVALARCERLIQLWADGETTSGAPWAHELLPNIPRLLRADIPQQSRAAADVIVLEHIDALAAIARERRLTRIRRDAEASWARDQLTTVQQAMRSRRDQHPPADAEADAVRAQALRDDENSMLAQVAAECAVQTTAWRDVYRSMLDAIAARAPEALPEPEHLALRLAYERSVWPARFRDVHSFEPYARAARTLTSLDPNRRAALAELHRASRDQMHRWYLTTLDAMRATPLDHGDSASVVAQRLELRMRADRAKRNTRVIWNIRALLTPEEREQIRGLDAYDVHCVVAAVNGWMQ